MSHEILRNRVTQFNSGPTDIDASRNYNVGHSVLRNSPDYTAVVESATIDLSMAVLDPTPPYRIMIFCELKDGAEPPGLVYGPNYFSFSGELSTVKQFVRWLQDTLLKKPQPVNLGLFELDKDDFFTYSIPQADYAANFVSGNFKVYFNTQLVPIMEGFVDEEDPLEADGELFYPMTPRSGTTTSTVDTMFRLNKIQAFLIKTTLPVTETSVLLVDSNVAVFDKILTTIEMNTMQYNLRTKADWKYIPTVYRHATMSGPGPLENYSVFIELLYDNTDRRVLILKPGEKMIVNIAFYPLRSVEY